MVFSGVFEDDPEMKCLACVDWNVKVMEPILISQPINKKKFMNSRIFGVVSWITFRFHRVKYI